MKHVLCFGDSNTWGFIPGTCKRYDEHTRWTGILQDELGADWRIHENGQNGRTTVFPEPGKNFMTGLGARLTRWTPCARWTPSSSCSARTT